MLWGDKERDQARVNLRRELSTLSATLKSAGADHLLIREIQRVRLNIAIIDVDVFRIGIERSAHPAHIRGDFLEGFDLPGCEEFEDWLRLERSRIEDLEDAAADLSTPPPPPSKATSSVEASEGAPPKPSVAVMAFFDNVASAERQWLSFAIADSLSRLLCQFPQLFVKSSVTVRRCQSEGLDAPEIAKKMALHYIVDGDLSFFGDKVRVGVSLVEGVRGEQIWAQNFVASCDEIHEMEVQIAHQIAPRIWTFVDQAERTKVLRHSAQSLQEYELYWKANALFREFRKDQLVEAIELLDKLVILKPSCPWATSLASFCHGVAYLLRVTPDREAARRRAVSFCQTALQYGHDNAEVLGYCAGAILVIGGDLERADSMISSALKLMPSFQPLLFWGGWIDLGRGDTARARERFMEALEVNPEAGARGQTLCGIGLALLLDGESSEALDYLGEAAVLSATFPMTALGLLAAARMAGRNEIAAKAAQILSGAETLEIVSIFRNQTHRTLLSAALGG